MEFIQGLYQDNQLASMSETVIVQISNETSRPVKLSEEAVRTLKHYLME